MGVNGLLPCLQSISNQVSLEKYRNLTVGVDAMCWLHKGVYASDPVTLAKSQFHSFDVKYDTQGNIARQLNFEPIVTNYDNHKLHSNVNRLCGEYVIKQVEVLTKRYQMNVVLVIDGASLPIKKSVNRERDDNRSRSFYKAMQAEKDGSMKVARRLYAQSCSITYDIKLELIRLCRKCGIAFIVAPYESDAQLARLAHSCNIDLVITEDSDLLLYGCPRVLFKADLQTGSGIEIQILRDLGDNEKLSFDNWTHDMFIFMCILSGCDYCNGISGLGLQTAHKYVRINRTPQKLFHALAKDGRLPKNFEQSFWMAFKTFRHQRVYCLEKGELDFLFPIEPGDLNVISWDFLGLWIEPEAVRELVTGRLHPESLIPWIMTGHIDSSYTKLSNIKRQDRLKQVGNEEPHGFSFFSRKRKSQNSVNEEQIEMIDDTLHMTLVTNNHNHPHVPIHFEDYRSTFIGSAFETLSRSLRRNNQGKRYDIRKALEKLRCSKTSQFHPKHKQANQEISSGTRAWIMSNNQHVETASVSATNSFDPIFSFPNNQTLTQPKAYTDRNDNCLVDELREQQYLPDPLRKITAQPTHENCLVENSLSIDFTRFSAESLFAQSYVNTIFKMDMESINLSLYPITNDVRDVSDQFLKSHWIGWDHSLMDPTHTACDSSRYLLTDIQ